MRVSVSATTQFHRPHSPVPTVATTSTGGAIRASTHDRLPSSRGVPPYKVSIAGKSYAVDLSFEPYRREAYRHRSIISQRESLNYDNIAGENVVNTAGLWRRNFNNWDLGAGQLFADHKRSAENRFYSSKGINPWVPNQATLHYDTKKVFNCSNADHAFQVHSAGPFQYFLQHDSVKFVDTRVGNYYSHPQTLTGMPVVSTPATYFLGITHNDSYIFIATGNGGIYYAPLGSTSASIYVAPGPIATTPYTADSYDSVFWGADNLWVLCLHAGHRRDRLEPPACERRCQLALGWMGRRQLSDLPRRLQFSRWRRERRLCLSDL